MTGNRRASVVVWAILLVALGLRLFLLDGQSLWYDEGVSAYMTPRSFAEIAAATAVDIHPPLYYWLLASWAAVFGQGELALRGLSVWFGVLTVWVTWRLGQVVDGRSVGLTAAALLAVSPLAVQYSQEVRMYAQAGLLAAASSWAALALLRAVSHEDASRRKLALLASGYGLLAAALLYTHYYGSLVVVAQALYVGTTLLLTRHVRGLLWFVLAGGIATLLFLPWLPVALRQTGYYPGLGSPQPAWALLLDAVNVLSIGIATTRFAFRAGLAPFLGLAALGTAWLWMVGGGGGESNGRGTAVDERQDEPGGRGKPRPYVGTVGAGLAPPAPSHAPPTPHAVYLPLFWLLLPIAGIVILSQTRPLYEPRFLMLVLPAWTILLAGGLVALWEGATRLLTARTDFPPAARQLVVAALAVVLAGSLLIPTVRSLASYYTDPVYARDNYRGLVETVTLREQPGDAIILTAPGQIEIFSYYYRGRADLFPLPLQRPIDPIDTRARLEALADGHQRIWLVRWAVNEADPGDLILGWVEGRGRRLGTQTFGRVELRLYDLGGTARVPIAPIAGIFRPG